MNWFDSKPETVWLDIEIVHETDQAMLVLVDEDEHWLPKSQICAHLPDWSRLEIKRWLAVKRGLVEE